MKEKTKSLLIFFLIVGYVTVNLIYLDRYPVPGQNDEDWYVGPAYMFLKESKFRFPSLPEELVTKLNFDNVLIIGRIHYYIQTLFIRLFSLSPRIARTPSFIAGLISLFLLFFLAKKLYNARVAIISTLFLGTSSWFIVSSHSCRPETICLVILLLITCMFSDLINSQKKYLAFIIGFLSTLGMSFHHTARTFPFILLFLLLAYRKKFNLKLLIFLFLGVILGVALWFILHTPFDTFVKQVKMFGGKNILEIGVINALILEVSRYVIYFWYSRHHRNMFLLVIFLGSILFYLLKFKKDNKKYLLLISAFLPPFVYMIFPTTVTTYPILYMFPFWIIMVSITFNELLYSTKRIVRNFGKFILGFLCLFFAIENFSIIYFYKKVNFNNFTEQLRKYLPRGSVILGPRGYWIFFADSNYYSIKNDLYCLVEEQEPFMDFIVRNEIDYVIIDQYTSDKIYGFLKANYTPIGVINDNAFGGPDRISLSHRIRYKTYIYKLDGETHKNDKKT